MKRPAIFFDRDNTLIANDGYLADPAGVVLVLGAADAIARARAMGFAAVTFSNQSGVARGLFAEEAVHAVNARMDEMLQDKNPRALIDRHEFCPYHPEAVVERYRQDSELRKPRPGMILQAAERLGLDLSRSWVIGDAPRDIEAGKTAGCRTILFSDPGLSPSAAAKEESAVRADFVASSLKEALEIIERNAMSDSPDNGNDTPATAETETVASSASAESEAEVAVAARSRPMTFADRVRAGMFQPARSESAADGLVDRPRRALPAGADKVLQRAEPTAEAAPVAAKPADHVGESKQVAVLLHQILDEVRMLRHRTPHMEFSVTKLLAGIVQVLVFPALFFAYLHRDVAQDFQSLLILALVLQAMTISLLIMGKQS